MISGQVTSATDGSPLPGATVSIPALGLDGHDGCGGPLHPDRAAGAPGPTVELQATFPDLPPTTVEVDARARRRDPGLQPGRRPSTSRSPSARARPARRRRRRCRSTSSRRGRSRPPAPARPTRSSRRSRPRSTSRARRSPTAPTRVRPATLRGLGSDQVLVLVNGKRRHTSALVHVNGTIGRGSTGVDLNAIPASAIESIEILRDGAAAQYGSDAIAGVINVVLKSGRRRRSRVEPQGRRHHPRRRRADRRQPAARAGRSAAARSSPPSSTATATRPTAPARTRGRRARATRSSSPTITGATPRPRTSWASSTARRRSTPTGTTSFYAFGGASRREGSHGGFFRRALRGPATWPPIYPNGFLPLIEPEVTDYLADRAACAARAASWFWDVSAEYGDNEFEFNVSRQPERLARARPSRPTRRASTPARWGSTSWSRNLDLSRELRGRPGRAAQRRLRPRARGARATRSPPASPPPTSTAASPTSSAARAPAGAQVFPGFRPSNEVDVDARQLRRLRRPRRRRARDAAPGPRRPLRGLRRLRQHQRLQADRALPAGRVVRAARRGQHRLPRAVARPVLLLDGQHELPGGRRRARALRGRHLPGRQPGGPGARRHATWSPRSRSTCSAGIVWNPTACASRPASTTTASTSRTASSSPATSPAPRVAALLAPFNVTGARFFTNAIDTETEGYDLTRGLHASRLGSAARSSCRPATTRPRTRWSRGRADAAAARRAPGGALRRHRAAARRVRPAREQPAPGGRLDARRALRDAAREPLRRVLPGRPAGGRPDLRARVAGRPRDRLRASRASPWPSAPRTSSTPSPTATWQPNSNLGIFTYPSHSPFGMNGRFVYSRVSFKF